VNLKGDVASWILIRLPAHSDRPVRAANGDPPWIGIHVLSEFVFCPRAGVLTFELGHEDTGEERDRVPPLDYLPDFRAGVDRRTSATGVAGKSAVCCSEWNRHVAGLLGVRSSWCVGYFDAVAAWPAADGGLGNSSKHGKAIFTLVLRRNEALKAVPEARPGPRRTLQPVHWWNLLKAGFTPVEYAGPHRDAATRLLGRPWRVLEKGSLRIPVFRKLWGAAELYPQHFVRMAAYCHVIEQSEGGHSPYGIILFGYGYTGCTVPNIAAHRHAFGEALEKARKLIDTVHKENQRR
jgi:hypothetical protein